MVLARGICSNNILVGLNLASTCLGLTCNVNIPPDEWPHSAFWKTLPPLLLPWGYSAITQEVCWGCCGLYFFLLFLFICTTFLPVSYCFPWIKFEVSACSQYHLQCSSILISCGDLLQLFSQHLIPLAPLPLISLHTSHLP